jgi:MFS family permease
VLVPVYQAEMAPKWIRGTLVCAYQFSITLGLLSASIVNIFTSRLDTSAAFRIPLGLQLVWALVLAVGMAILPETPRFLIKRGQPREAGLALSRLRRLDITHPALQNEIAEIVANHEYELALGPDSYASVFNGSPHLGRRLLTGCGVQMLQQLTGINFIMYYSTTFFNGAGVEDPYTKSLIIQIINTVSTIPGLMVIETWGRRKLLIVGSVGMAVCQLLIASFSAAAGDHLQSEAQTILIVFCAIFIFFFAASWGPVAWVITAEIYPLKTRAKANSISTASNWMLNFAISYGTPYLVGDGVGTAALGPKVFFVWGAFCIVSIVFVWCLVYETRRLSLEQIDEMYERVDRAWGSTAFEPTWSFQTLMPLAHDWDHDHAGGGGGGGAGSPQMQQLTPTASGTGGMVEAAYALQTPQTPLATPQTPLTMPQTPLMPPPPQTPHAAGSGGGSSSSSNSGSGGNASSASPAPPSPAVLAPPAPHTPPAVDAAVQTANESAEARIMASLGNVAFTY